MHKEDKAEEEQHDQEQLNRETKENTKETNKEEQVPRTSNPYGDRMNMEDIDLHAINAGNKQILEGKNNRDVDLQVGNVVNASQQITRKQVSPDKILHELV
ncbi:hypothetical protein HAX54_009921 [Datura stramonium]|uniref:Uncharacterized protein n=1 Tax=Datura stramonium TaxID=4076 RepID=A0ABS8TI77_DATST|nr:hypothetical protein [Datura stramonium]